MDYQKALDSLSAEERAELIDFIRERYPHHLAEPLMIGDSALYQRAMAKLETETRAKLSEIIARRPECRRSDTDRRREQ